jgi:hypothetical protein
MPASEERVLEDALVVLLEALPYITAQSIAVRNWDDQTPDRVLPCVTVRVSPRERIAPNADFYRLPVDVICQRQRGDDPTQAVQDLLVSEVSEWAYARGGSLKFGDDKTLAGVGAAADAFVRGGNGDGSAWTFSARFKPTGAGTQTILFAGGTYGASGGVEFNIVGSSFRVRYGDALNWLSFDAAGIVAGQWNNVICIFDGGTTGADILDIADYYSRFTFWVNGVSVSPAESNNNNGYTGSIGYTHFVVGGTTENQYLSSGFLLGDVAIWDSDETANFNEIFFGGAPRDLSSNASAPQFYYRFRDRATPNAVTDTMGAKDLAHDGIALVDFLDTDYSEGFNTVSIDIDGITYNPGVEDVQDSIHSRGVSFDIYDTIA